MKDFKNTTKTQYSMGGYAKGGSKGAAKVGVVMHEFKAGTLHSGSKKGPEVSNPKQAIAIALSEARKTGAKVPMKKAEGGSLKADMAQDKAMVKKAVHKHEAAMHPGKPMTKLRKGGMAC